MEALGTVGMRIKNWMLSHPKEEPQDFGTNPVEPEGLAGQGKDNTESSDVGGDQPQAQGHCGCSQAPAPLLASWGCQQ